MTRTVQDAALVLGALTGIDEKDSFTRKSVGNSFTDFTPFLNANSLQNKRIGVARHFFGFHEKVDRLMDQAIKDLQNLGAKTIDLDKEDLNGKSGSDAWEVLLYEFKHDLNEYLKNCSSDINIRSLEQLIKFNKDHAVKEMPFFGQEILISAQEKGDLNSDDYKKAIENVLQSNGTDGIDRVLDKYEIDAIIAPTGAPSWPIDVINGDHHMGGSSSPAARSGYPSITVPMGFIHELPIGVSFFAEAFSEPKLISFAYAFEQATKHRKAPKFIPTFDISLEL
jgi:amidase